MCEVFIVFKFVFCCLRVLRRKQMCRFLIYKGKRILLADILSRPEHSLISQASRREAYTPGVEKSENYSAMHTSKRNHNVNADGFGIAYYDSMSRSHASLFKSVTPAWSNANLAELLEVMYGDLIFAHIRAASHMSPVSLQNCHPFRRGRLVFMHNGGISGIKRIRRNILNSLTDSIYSSVNGTTDSELAFALFLSQFPPEDVDGPAAVPDMRSVVESSYLTKEQMVRGMRNTILQIMELQKNTGLSHLQAASSLNFAVTDGKTTVVTRCRTHPKHDPPTLYYCCTSRVAGMPDSMSCTDQSKSLTIHCKSKRMNERTSLDSQVIRSHSYDYSPRKNIVKLTSTPPGSPAHSSKKAVSEDRRFGAVVISSEPLDYTKKWVLIPKDSILVLDCEGNLSISLLELPAWEEVGKVMLTPSMTPLTQPTDGPDLMQNSLNLGCIRADNSDTSLLPRSAGKPSSAPLYISDNALSTVQEEPGEANGTTTLQRPRFSNSKSLDHDFGSENYRGLFKRDSISSSSRRDSMESTWSGTSDSSSSSRDVLGMLRSDQMALSSPHGKQVSVAGKKKYLKRRRGTQGAFSLKRYGSEESPRSEVDSNFLASEKSGPTSLKRSTSSIQENRSKHTKDIYSHPKLDTNGEHTRWLPWLWQSLGLVKSGDRPSMGNILIQCLLTSTLSFAAGYLTHRWMSSDKRNRFLDSTLLDAASSTEEEGLRRTASKPLSLRRTVTRPANSGADGDITSSSLDFDPESYPPSGSLS